MTYDDPRQWEKGAEEDRVTGERTEEYRGGDDKMPCIHPRASTTH